MALGRWVGPFLEEQQYHVGKVVPHGLVEWRADGLSAPSSVHQRVFLILLIHIGMVLLDEHPGEIHRLLLALQIRSQVGQKACPLYGGAPVEQLKNHALLVDPDRDLFSVMTAVVVKFVGDPNPVRSNREEGEGTVILLVLDIQTPGLAMLAKRHRTPPAG